MVYDNSLLGGNIEFFKGTGIFFHGAIGATFIP